MYCNLCDVTNIFDVISLTSDNIALLTLLAVVLIPLVDVSWLIEFTNVSVGDDQGLFRDGCKTNYMKRVYDILAPSFLF